MIVLSLFTYPNHTSIPDTIEKWKEANGCMGDEVTSYFEMGNVHAELTGECDGGEIVICTIEGGGHEWPADENFNVNEALWNFFKEHPISR